MTASLTPALALAHLRELSVDVRAAVVLDASGAALAGDARLGAPVQALLGAADGVRRERRADGELLAVRRRDGLALAVLAAPHALLPLLEHDLAAVVEAIAGAADATP
jgi:hypothetical protein